MQIEFVCDLSGKPSSLKHFWEYCVGSDHAPMALRADWQKQLQRCHAELGFERVRFHGLLSDDLGTLVREKDEIVYSFFNADQIFDFLISTDVHPFVELGFMPTALASGGKTVFHYHANVTPPRDYKQWATLIRKLVSHWLDRYGIEEMEQWNFEVWNEPNLNAFWTGTQKDYFKLYRYTAEAIKSVHSSLKVGGPATAKNEWIEEFREFCERKKLPLDFISTHHYPTDAFGKPDDDTETQLSKSRRGALRDEALDARRGAADLPLYYTEWNSSSNPFDALHDQPYAAAFVVKSVMDVAGVVDAYSFWTFSDIFEENYFSSIPFHGGFGLLTLHGIAKPAYRAFQLLHRLGMKQLLVDGLHETANVWVVRDDDKLTVLMSNSALPGHSIKSERVSMRLLNAPQPRAAWIERIDKDHANPRRVWREMGAPPYLSEDEVGRLVAASETVREQQRFNYQDKVVSFEINLPPHSVAAIECEFAEDLTREER
ncbi:MAG: GH39 family glycosyl hydrolase [Pyrinomonadaceae bacterium]